MTRFARADGSKASNKKTLEEATPWKAMQKDMKETKRKIKSKVTQGKKKAEGNLQLGTEGHNAEDKWKTDVKKSSHSDEAVETKIKKRNRKKNSKNLEDGEPPKKKISDKDRKNNFIVEDGKKLKVFKDGQKRPWLDLPYGENDVMTQYHKFYVKHEAVPMLDEFRKSLEKLNLPPEKIRNKMLNKERKAHNTLRLDLMRAQIKQRKANSSSSVNTPREDRRQIAPNQSINQSLREDAKKSVFSNERNFRTKFQENDIMTEYDGFWILREELQFLQSVNEKKKERIVNERTDGNMDPNLTAEEELTHRRLMKKEKRRAEGILKAQLQTMGPKAKNRSKPWQPSMGLDKWGESHTEESSFVRFNGVSVKRDGAHRLRRLQDEMWNRGCTMEEINEAMKLECRREERVVKRETRACCFRCRAVGHMSSDCPKNGEDGSDVGVHICFKCGSTEHMARDCTTHKTGPLTYATCFICGEQGHITRECPDNPRGLYPNGGCCNECGSVEHLKRDCPDLQKKFADTTIKLDCFHPGQTIEDVDFDQPEAIEEKPPIQKKQKLKTIKF